MTLQWSYANVTFNINHSSLLMHVLMCVTNCPHKCFSLALYSVISTNLSTAAAHIVAIQQLVRDIFAWLDISFSCHYIHVRLTSGSSHRWFQAVPWHPQCWGPGSSWSGWSYWRPAAGLDWPGRNQSFQQPQTSFSSPCHYSLCSDSWRQSCGR